MRMNKEEFMNELRDRLKDYPAEETVKSIEYYEEAILDHMEDGMTEGEAIASFGKLEDIVSEIKSELPLKTIIKQKTKGRKLPVWALVLIIVFAPMWFSILITLLCMYFCVWVMIGCLWIFTASMGIGAIAFFIWGIMHLFDGVNGIYGIGCSLFCGGIGVFMALGSFYASKGVALGTKWGFKQIKKELTETEEK